MEWKDRKKGGRHNKLDSTNIFPQNNNSDPISILTQQHWYSLCEIISTIIPCSPWLPNVKCCNMGGLKNWPPSVHS